MQRFALNGFPVCETRDASEILEAIMLRKQTQSNPLFAGVLRWLAGDCVQALQVWHAIDKSNVNDSAIKRDAERALALGYAN